MFVKLGVFLSIWLFFSQGLFDIGSIIPDFPNAVWHGLSENDCHNSSKVEGHSNKHEKVVQKFDAKKKNSIDHMVTNIDW